jgi:hypothetical protein
VSWQPPTRRRHPRRGSAVSPIRDRSHGPRLGRGCPLR